MGSPRPGPRRRGQGWVTAESGSRPGRRRRLRDMAARFAARPHPPRSLRTWVMRGKEQRGGERAGCRHGRLREDEEVPGESQPCSQPGCKSAAGVTVGDAEANPSQRAVSRRKPGVKP